MHDQETTDESRDMRKLLEDRRFPRRIHLLDGKVVAVAKNPDDAIAVPHIDSNPLSGMVTSGPPVVDVTAVFDNGDGSGDDDCVIAEFSIGGSLECRGMVG